MQSSSVHRGLLKKPHLNSTDQDFYWDLNHTHKYLKQDLFIKIHELFSEKSIVNFKEGDKKFPFKADVTILPGISSCGGVGAHWVGGSIPSLSEIPCYVRKGI